MASTSGLTKVRVDLPHHPTTGGEALWAYPIGSDLYELRNVPMFAYGLNYRDIVLATSDSPDALPEIRKVVKRNGHRTLRVVFATNVPEAKKVELLQSLRFLSTSFERATDRFFALDLAPRADLARVRAVLDDWNARGWSEYETCEPRSRGRFDDTPWREREELGIDLERE
jgi:uncharacterized protein DUF4265